MMGWKVGGQFREEAECESLHWPRAWVRKTGRVVTSGLSA